MVAFAIDRATSDRPHSPSGATPNVSDTERIASVAGGAMLLLYGPGKNPLGALLWGGLGAALIYRGMTGHCSCYQALGISTREQHEGATSVPAQYGFKYEKSLIVNRSAQDLFDFWRDFENLPRIMPHLKSVTDLGSGRSHWVAAAPAGFEASWDAEVYNEEA